MTAWLLLATTVLPWVSGLVIILYVRKLASSTDKCIWDWALLSWVAFVFATVPPLLIWNEDETGANAAIESMISQSLETSSSTILHVLRYVAPFGVIPVAVFWAKIMVNHKANEEETDGVWTHIFDMDNTQSQKQQSKLIAFVIKTIVMIFVFFGVLDKVGIPTGDVLQVTTVFSLGLSWSMRDWLGSLWAAFMLAFTTELTCGSIMLLATPPPGFDAGAKLRVVKTGIIYTVVTTINKQNEQNQQFNNYKCAYVSNGSLLTGGFTLVNE